MKACVTCQKPGKLGICEACAGKAEAFLYPPVPWTKFEPADTHIEIQGLGYHECWKNSRYTVLVRRTQTEMGELVQLSIKRNDKNPIHDWREIQRIKNELLGPEEEAVEIYPAESRLVDSANQFFCWSLKGQRVPFGFEVRLVMEDAGSTGAKQRPFEVKPADLLSEEEFQQRLAAHKAGRQGEAS